MSIVTYDDLDTPVFEIDFLRYLFTNGAQGSFWGPLPYYSDAAGTVEADWGDPVGNIPDASGNGNDWTQATSTARPILGRVPVGGRRNNLIQTENLAGSAWSSHWSPDTTIGGIAGGLTTVNFTATSTDRRFPRRQRLPVVAASPGKKRYIRARFKLGVGMTTAAVGLFRSEGVFAWVAYNTVTEVWSTYSFSTIGALVEVSAEELEPGVWELVAEHTESEDGAPLYVTVHFGTGAASDLRLNSPVGSCEIGFVQCSDTNGPYQRVGSEYDITEAGVKGIHYLRFDGTDDAVTTTLPAISGGTIVLAGTNGIWIDSLDFAGGAFSVGPDTYTGGPAGLMAILGDILERGCFVIDRALTPEEIAQVKGYYVARGAGDLIEEMP